MTGFWDMAPCSLEGVEQSKRRFTLAKLLGTISHLNSRRLQNLKYHSLSVLLFSVALKITFIHTFAITLIQHYLPSCK
jgi:hypothetical protein